MQDPEHILSKCPTCLAKPGQLCVTREGYVAERVHYGRPEWSARTSTAKGGPFTKLRGMGGWEATLNIIEFKVIYDVWPRDSELPNTRERPLLADGTDFCGDCGEPYGGQGLLTRCAKRHHGGKLKVHLK